MNVFIIGSCVTRDAFTPDLLRDEFVIKRYWARTSLARFKSGVGSIHPDEINVSSKFQKKMIANDINNQLFEEIKVVSTEPIDFIILDLVDDRFGLVEFKEGVYITNSDELRAAKLLNTREAQKIAPNSEEYRSYWEAGLIELLKHFPKEKIIINNVYWSRETELGEGVSSPERIAFCEAVVGGLYEIARKYVPEENFVNYPSGIFVADSKHRWGKSPFHYTQPVYDYLIDYLRRHASIAAR